LFPTPTKYLFPPPTKGLFPPSTKGIFSIIDQMPFFQRPVGGGKKPLVVGGKRHLVGVGKKHFGRCWGLQLIATK
jgi:hypothetical protein